MNLTPELKAIGRRNFLRAIAGTPAVAALAGATALEAPRRGGPVRAALIGAGGQGKVHLGQCQKGWIDLRAVCDINPKHAAEGADGLAKMGWERPRTYADYREMLEKEDLEAVIVATPLRTHADVTVACLEAGKHVLCEKMMAWDAAGCARMRQAARTANRVLEIGHQRFYSPAYQAAYEGLVKTGKLGDVYHFRALWHRNGSWRRDEKPPSAGFDPRPFGYADWEHLVNWRLYREHSQGLAAELGSHQVAIANWFFEAPPEAVYAAGAIARYEDGREVNDHVYVTWEYAGGRTAVWSSIQSNKFDGNYEQIMGTKGTLILRGEGEAYFFGEDEAVTRSTALEISRQTANPVVDASESRRADARGRTIAGAAAGGEAVDPLLPNRAQLAGFCAAIRSGTPLGCGAERAEASAIACIKANEAAEKKARIAMAAG